MERDDDEYKSGYDTDQGEAETKRGTKEKQKKTKSEHQTPQFHTCK